MMEHLESAIRIVGIMRAAGVPLTNKAIAAQVIIERAPSRFPMPEALCKRVIDELRRAGYVERKGTRYVLAPDTRPELPPGMLYTDPEGRRIVTDRWCNRGRVSFIREPGEPDRFLSYGMMVRPANVEMFKHRARAAGLTFTEDRSDFGSFVFVKVAGTREHIEQIVQLSRDMSYA